MADITIPRNTAQQLYELYNNVVAADAHYKRCQSDNFRVHIKAVYQSEAVANAFDQLKARMDAAEKTSASQAAEKPRKGVLTED